MKIALRTQIFGCICAGTLFDPCVHLNRRSDSKWRMHDLLLKLGVRFVVLLYQPYVSVAFRKQTWSKSGHSDQLTRSSHSLLYNFFVCVCVCSCVTLFSAHQHLNCARLQSSGLVGKGDSSPMLFLTCCIVSRTEKLQQDS